MRFTSFDFKKEAGWLMVLYILIPLAALFLAIGIPSIMRWWSGG